MVVMVMVMVVMVVMSDGGDSDFVVEVHDCVLSTLGRDNKFTAKTWDWRPSLPQRSTRPRQL